MPHLNDLPQEILVLIGQWTPLSALSSLARTGHYFFDILNPVLYRRHVEDGPMSSCVLWAATHDSLSTMKRAFKYGLDLNCDGSSGIAIDYKLPWDRIPGRKRYFATALHIAAQRDDIEMVKWLLANGADAKAWSRDFCSCSPITTTWYPLHTAMCHSGSVDMVSLFVSHGAHMVAQSRPGLHTAVASGSPEMVDLFLKDGRVDINESAMDGTTSLHHLAACRDTAQALEVLAKLVQRDANINVVDKEGQTPFLTALLLNKYSLALRLLGLGADLNLGRPERPLLQQCFSTGPREGAEEFEKCRIELVKILLAHGEDITMRFSNGEGIGTALFFAAAFAKSITCVQLLLDAGAQLDASVVDALHGWDETFLRGVLRHMSPADTLSDVLLKDRCEDIIRLLVSKGANLGSNDGEQSALEYALECAEDGETGLLRLLSEIATEENISASHVQEVIAEIEPEDDEDDEDEEEEKDDDEEGDSGEDEESEDGYRKPDKKEITSLLESLLLKARNDDDVDDKDAVMEAELASEMNVGSKEEVLRFS